MGLRKNTGRSASATQRKGLPRWARLLITSVVIFIIPFFVPDLVPDLISKVLSQGTSQFTGLEPFLKAFLLIWIISSAGLFAAGIVDLFFSLSRS